MNIELSNNLSVRVSWWSKTWHWLHVPLWRLWRWVWIVIGCVVIVVGLLGWHNIATVKALHAAQTLDKNGQYQQAQAKLRGVNHFGILPNILKQVKTEQSRSQQLAATAQKLQQVQQLLKQHKTQEAQNLPKLISNGSTTENATIKNQVAQLQKTTQQQAASGSSSQTKTSTSPASSPTAGTGGSSGGTSSGGSGGGGTSGGGSGSGGSGGSGGGTGGSGSGPNTSPMTQITINSFSATTTPYNASNCFLNGAINFAANGSGSVTVTWQVLSTKTSSSIYNPVSYSFSAAGSQADNLPGSSLQGLEAGDSYRISAVVTDAANGSIVAIGGPTTISSCAAPQSLLTAGQPSFMSSGPTLTNLTSSQYQDPIFSNECSINVQASFSVSGPGSVQLTYVFTSASSIGATLYSIQQYDFTGPGSATDSSYARKPHLPGNGLYTIQAILNVLGDPAHTTIGSTTISSACT